MEFGDIGFCGERKTGEPGEKLLEQSENQQQTNPHMAPGQNQTQRETSVLAIAPSLLHKHESYS